MKSNIIICLIVIGTFLLSVVCFSLAYESTNSINRHPELIASEAEKNHFIQGGQKVPDELEEKLDFLNEYDKQYKKDLEKSLLEIENIKITRENSVKDEKGYPLINHPQFDKPAPRDVKDIGIYTDHRYYDGLFASDYELQKYEFNSVAYLPYGIVIAGCLKSDSSVGILYEINNDPDNENGSRIEHAFIGKGAISLTSIKEDAVEFLYANNKEGSFYIKTGEAVFR